MAQQSMVLIGNIDIGYVLQESMKREKERCLVGLREKKGRGKLRHA